MNVAAHPETILDLCAGVGQLGYGLHAGLAAVGMAGRTVCHVERDAAAAALLVARMEAAEVDQALVWDDLATFDARRFRGRVSGVCAGLPCPAYSSAGKRIGNDDPRAWGEGFDPDDVATWGPVPHAIRIITESEAGFVFFENVPQWVTSGAYEPVGRELRRLGFTRQKCVFVAASDIGANHKRERVFVLAVTEQWRRRVCQQIGGSDRGTAAGRAGEALAGMEHGVGGGCVGAGLPAGPGYEGVGAERVGRAGEKLADSHVNERAESGQEPGRGPDQRAVHDGGLAGSVKELAHGGGGARREGAERGRALRDEGAAARGPVAERGGDVGDGERNGRQARNGHAGEVASPEAGQAGGVELSDKRLPLHPPPRGTDLAAVARALAEAAERDAADHVSPGTRGSESRRVAAAACRLARGVWRDWELVARLDPARMPAVESGVSVVAHADPYATADLLRVGGNCVVWQTAAGAFCHLFDRVIGGGA